MPSAETACHKKQMHGHTGSDLAKGVSNPFYIMAKDPSKTRKKT